MFNLTKQERQVILFLSGVALVGLGLDFLGKKFNHAKPIAAFALEIGKIDINQADKSVLMGLSGIGEKLAQRIVDYRIKHSGFRHPEELKNIKGITAYRYEKMKDSLIVR